MFIMEKKKVIIALCCTALFFKSPIILVDKNMEFISEEEQMFTYTFKDIQQTMYATGSVNIRTLPSMKGEKVGMLSKDQKVSVTGRCNETGRDNAFFFQFTYPTFHRRS